MDLRATSQTRVSSLVFALQRSAAHQSKLQIQISSGIKLQAPSDGPSQYVTAHAAQAAADRLGVYLDTSVTATNDLNAGVSALLQSTDALSRANVLALQAVNDPNDPTALEAAANEINEIIQRVLTAANSESGGQALFAGTATGQTAYAITARDAAGRPTAITYQGDTQRSQAIVGAGETVDTRYAGNEVFQSSAGDVFKTLIGLRDELRDTSLTAPARAQAVTARIDQIKTARDAILTTVGDQSASLEKLESAQNHMTDLQLSLQTRAGDLQGTDYADAIARLSDEQALYQATLALTAKVFGPMLFDYLQ